MRWNQLQASSKLLTISAWAFLIMMNVSGQVSESVSVKENSVTSYEELSSRVQDLDQSSDLLKVKVIGTSVQGRNIYAMMFSSTKFGNEKSKLRVLIFAQQHGDEQSGKEGALILAEELIKPENRYLFDRIDLMLVPQVNPDGSEVNVRRNANNADLNRNHLILSEPETRALHNMFDKYLFEVTMDVHEYYPYSEEWINFGYRKNSEVMVGCVTNPAVSEEIRDLANTGYLPFIFKYLKEEGFSSFVYCPGGPPENHYIRHSTFDINDGRQSLGIQNTFSFIQEGMNGDDSFLQNLGRRAAGQMHGMRGLLEYAYRNQEKIRSLVTAEREKLISGSSGKDISIQCEHTGNGSKLDIPLYSYSSGQDTVFTVTDYRPVVSSLSDVEKPAGYLVPKDLTLISDWAARHSIELMQLKYPEDYLIEQYTINRIDSIDFEGDIIVNPQVVVKDVTGSIAARDYFFITTSQLKGNMIILALESKSMLGLVTYKDYAHLLKKGETYPILRVIAK